MSAADAARAVAAILEAGPLPEPIEAELAGRLLAALAYGSSDGSLAGAQAYAAQASAACDRALLALWGNWDSACEACGAPIPRGYIRCPLCLIV